MIETSKSLGGRIKGKVWDDYYIEEGASWITGTKNNRGRTNPLWTLAQACNLQTRGLQDTVKAFDTARGH